jgi:subtilisin family serine protease
MEVLVLFADHDTVALRYTREDSSAPPGYTIHIDNICTDPNLLALYNTLDDPSGPRYQYPNASYGLPNLYAGQSFGVARTSEVVVAIADTGSFQDPRSLDEWWQIRPGYSRYPADVYYTNQWALERVRAPQAWAHSTGRDIVVAVLDTGVDLDHPDLMSKVLTDLDRDFVNDDFTAADDHGHGTHVAGIAAAATDNGLGIAGLGWDVRILPLKVLDSEGNGDGLNLAAAIRYAADRGADVINMSLGGAVPCGWPVDDAVNDAHSRGVTLIAAAGNYLGDTEMFPANCEHVLGVAATDEADMRAPYSNYGGHVSVAAPGSRIYSTIDGGSYDYDSGTSMATPHVASLAALLLARYPLYTPDQIASAILDNAQDLGAPGWEEYYGCGRMDASLALATGALNAQPICMQGVGSWAEASPRTFEDARYVPGEVIVGLLPGASARTVLDRYGAGAEFVPALGAWRLHVPPGRERTVLAQMRSDADVAHAGLNYLVSAQ